MIGTTFQFLIHIIYYVTLTGMAFLDAQSYAYQETNCS